ncbi:single-stranded DNA-binding protein [Glaciibacter flavus]|uniref:single-stranded DNA-binding protein n=1 Tax=Orlajensenia flava TaxID=2565934 RepID=UPI003B001BD3
MTDTITITGVVGTEPASFQTSGGVPMVSFRLASSHRYLDRKTQEWVDSPANWYTVQAYRQLATTCAARYTRARASSSPDACAYARGPRRSARESPSTWTPTRSATTSCSVSVDSPGSRRPWRTRPGPSRRTTPKTGTPGRPCRHRMARRPRSNTRSPDLDHGCRP